MRFQAFLTKNPSDTDLARFLVWAIYGNNFVPHVVVRKHAYVGRYEQIILSILIQHRNKDVIG